MIQRTEGGAVPVTQTHMFVIYVELQEPGPSIEAIETKLSDGIVWLEGVGHTEAHYLATAEAVQAEILDTGKNYREMAGLSEYELNTPVCGEIPEEVLE